MRWTTVGTTRLLRPHFVGVGTGAGAGKVSEQAHKMRRLLECACAYNRPTVVRNIQPSELAVNTLGPLFPIEIFDVPLARYSFHTYRYKTRLIEYTHNPLATACLAPCPS